FIFVLTIAAGCSSSGSHHASPTGNSASRDRLSADCLRSMRAMAQLSASADDAKTAAVGRATVVDCRSAAEWRAAAAEFPKPKSEPLDLHTFCVNARGIRTATCRGAG